MVDPFREWSRMVSAGLDMQSIWLRSMQALQPSPNILGPHIDRRHVTWAYVDDAILSKVPETVKAFNVGVQAVTRTTAAMHSVWAGQMRHVGMMMLSKPMPSAGEAVAPATRGAEYAMATGARLANVVLVPKYRARTVDMTWQKRADG